MKPPLLSVRVHAAIAGDSVTRNAIVRYPALPDPALPPVILPFTAEIHSTSDFNGIAVIAPVNFSLPTPLATIPDLSTPGAFTSYLDSIAAAVPVPDPDSAVKVLLIEF